MAVPYLLMSLLFVLNIISLSYPLNGGVKVPLILMAIYYWSIFRPSIVPSWFVFIVGIAFDFLGGSPLGMNASIFVAVQWIISDQRRFLMGQPFVMVWCGFCVVAVLATFVQWFFFGLIHFQWTFSESIWISLVLGVSLFPFVSVLLYLTHRMLPGQEGKFRSQR